MSMYYGGGGSAGGSSYSSPFLGSGGNYSKHSSLGGTYGGLSSLGGNYTSLSSLGGYSRPAYTSGNRTPFVPSRSAYSPLLSSISESLNTRRPGTSSAYARLSPKVQSHISPKYKSSTYQKPISINTEDIDVSYNKYGRNRTNLGNYGVPAKISPRSAQISYNSQTSQSAQNSQPAKSSPPAHDSQAEKPFQVDENGLERGRSTIQRGRAVVRLRTVRRKDKDSPRSKLTEEDSNESDISTNIADQGKKSKWRDNMPEDMLTTEKRQKKSPGEMLVDKFKIRDKRDEEIIPGEKTKFGSKETPSTSSTINNSGFAIPAQVKRHRSSKRQSLRNDMNPPIASSQNAYNNGTEIDKLSKHSQPSSLAGKVELRQQRRLSKEMLEEQASFFDALIRDENLSTKLVENTQSKLDIHQSSADISRMGSKKKRKESTAFDKNVCNYSQMKTKSDNSIDQMERRMEHEKSPSPLSNRRSGQKLKRSTSSNMLGSTLGSIMEIPKEAVDKRLNSINENPVLTSENTALKSISKPKISSTVEITNEGIYLKARIDDVVVEQVKKPQIQNLLQYDVVLEGTKDFRRESRNDKRGIDNFDLYQHNNQNDAANLSPLQRKPSKYLTDYSEDVGNFWEKNSRRETVYYKDRKKRLAEEAENRRKALFWAPEEDVLEVAETGDGDSANSNFNASTNVFGETLSNGSDKSNKKILEVEKPIENCNIQRTETGLAKPVKCIETKILPKPKEEIQDQKAIFKNEEGSKVNIPKLDLPTKKNIVESPNTTDALEVEDKIIEPLNSPETLKDQTPSVAKSDGLTIEILPLVESIKIDDLVKPTSPKESTHAKKEDYVSLEKQKPAKIDEAKKINNVPKNIKISDVKVENNVQPKKVFSEICPEKVVSPTSINLPPKAVTKKPEIIQADGKASSPTAAAPVLMKKSQKKAETEKPLPALMKKMSGKKTASPKTKKLQENVVPVKEDTAVQPDTKVVNNKNTELPVDTAASSGSRGKNSGIIVPADVSSTASETVIVKLEETVQKSNIVAKDSPKDNKKDKTVPVTNTSPPADDLPRGNSIVTVIEGTSILASEAAPRTLAKVVETTPEPDPQTREESPPIPLPALVKRPVKEEAPLRPIFATPRPLRKRAPKVVVESSSEESSEEETEESSSEEESSQSDAENDDFYECEVGNSNKKKSEKNVRTSTSSNDSGFDSYAPSSPGGIVCIKKGKHRNIIL